MQSVVRGVSFWYFWENLERYYFQWRQICEGIQDFLVPLDCSPSVWLIHQLEVIILMSLRISLSFLLSCKWQAKPVLCLSSKKPWLLVMWSHNAQVASNFTFGHEGLLSALVVCHGLCGSHHIVFVWSRLKHPIVFCTTGPLSLLESWTCNGSNGADSMAVRAATKLVRIWDTSIVTAHVWSMHVNAVRWQAELTIYQQAIHIYTKVKQ